VSNERLLGGNKEITKVKPRRPHKCRRCGGRAPFDEAGGVYICTNCSNEEMELREYYQFCEANKQEILQDVADIGPIKTRFKWKMPPQAWHALRQRWGIHKIWVSPGIIPVSYRIQLPRLPRWRTNWPPEVKVAWLEVYLARLKDGHKCQ